MLEKNKERLYNRKIQAMKKTVSKVCVIREHVVGENMTQTFMEYHFLAQGVNGVVSCA